MKRKICLGITAVSIVMLAGCGETKDGSAAVIRPETTVETRMEETETEQSETESFPISEIQDESHVQETIMPESQTQETKVQQTESGDTISEEGDSTDNQREMYQIYADIVQKYEDNYKLVGDVGVEDAINEDVNMEFTIGAQYEIQNGTKHAGFSLYDINEDGIDELFVGLGEELWVYDFYTYSEGQAVKLMDYIGYRAGTCVLCEGGVVWDQSSNGAAHSMSQYYILPWQGRALETIDSISIHGSENNPDEIHYYRSYEADPEKEISEEEFNSIQNSYAQINPLSSQEASDENIEMLSRGELK